MSPKVIPLSLDGVGWQHEVSAAIIEGKNRGETGHGDPHLDPRADHPLPGVLAVFDS